eukprot:CAMPEP_0185037044 /NCGR_PEP_ID=MMETSP1103-20130426/30923_1 /TAXON_ID=36769 /ORGANISM="Paraphysomonas bandaiensis, Strain Caron Lab Isolate" /LENGTH=657 /DNA_ID=CAMNT_0027574841 /DNA_START=76 /DNA_END=2049 /DNA_ORIENTATION=+
MRMFIAVYLITLLIALSNAYVSGGVRGGVTPTNEIQSAITQWELLWSEDNKRVNVSSNNDPSCVSNAIVTFIIPTKFRPSLRDTLDSLIDQRSCHWRAIVVFYTDKDSVDHPAGKLRDKPPLHHYMLPMYQILDERIQFLGSDASSKENFAGNLRNDGFAHVETDWIGFVDDDDTLVQSYVHKLKYEAIVSPAADVIIFRMLCSTCFSLVIPPAEHVDIVPDYVGISFALKRHLVKPFGRHAFTAGGAEDFCMLFDLRNSGTNMIMSPAIGYLVKGPKPQYSSMLTNFTASRRVIEFTGPPLVPPDTCLTDANKSRTPFLYPDVDSTMFGANVVGANRSILAAAHKGCMTPFLWRNPVKIYFSINTPITPGPYIQVQMNHITSNPVSSGRWTAFSSSYIRRLQNAVQVWTVVPSHYHFMKTYLKIEQTFFVPMWLMTDISRTSERVCASGVSRSQCSPVIAEHVGSLPTFVNDSNVESALSLCTLYPRGCPTSVGADHIPGATYMPCTLPKVLMFGSLTTSNDNRRLKLCLMLKRSVPDFDCFQTVFGYALDSLICSADVIILDGYFRSDTSYAYTVDTLLLMGKVVISTENQDAEIQAMYADSVVFVKSVAELPFTIRNIMSKPDVMYQLQNRGREFVLKQSKQLAPLCRALSSVG